MNMEPRRRKSCLTTSNVARPTVAQQDPQDETFPQVSAFDRILRNEGSRAQIPSAPLNTVHRVLHTIAHGEYRLRVSTWTDSNPKGWVEGSGGPSAGVPGSPESPY